MNVRLIRHATLELEVGGRRVLVDPMLDPAGARPAVANTPNPRPNPLVELPEPAEDVVGRADAVLVTHLHADHLDETAVRLIGDRLPVFGQPEDVDTLVERGLARASAVDDRVEWEGLEIIRTGGRHGTGELAGKLGPVSGFVVRGDGSSVYVAGDTVWCEQVGRALGEHEPETVVLNAGAARFFEGGLITMGDLDVLAVRRAAPEARIVAVHLEAINHCLQTRPELAAALDGAGVLIPADGEAF